MSYSTKQGRELLLTWIKDSITSYGIDVADFGPSFVDGQAILALLHSQKALEDYDGAKNLDRDQRIKLALETVEKLGIETALDVSDLNPDEPNTVTIISFLGALHKHFNPNAAPRGRNRKNRAEEKPDETPAVENTTEPAPAAVEPVAAVPVEAQQQQPEAVEADKLYVDAIDTHLKHWVPLEVVEPAPAQHTEDPSVLLGSPQQETAATTTDNEQPAAETTETTDTTQDNVEDADISDLETRMKRMRELASSIENNDDATTPADDAENDENKKSNDDIIVDDLGSTATLLGKMGNLVHSRSQQVDEEEQQQDEDTVAEDNTDDLLAEPKIKPKYQHVLSSDPFGTEEVDPSLTAGKKERRKYTDEEEDDEDIADPGDLEEMLEDAQETIAELRDQLSHAESLRDRYKKQYAAALADAHNYEKQAIDLQNRCIDNDKEIKRHLDKITELKRISAADQKKQEQDVQQLQDQLAEEQEKTEELIRANKKAERELSRLQSMIDAEKKEKNKIEIETKKALDELHVLKQELQTSEERLKVEQKEKDHLSTDVKNLHSVMEKEVRARSKLQEQLKDLQTEKDQFKKKIRGHEEEIRKLQNEKKQFNYELQNLQKLLMEERTLRADLESQTGKLKKEFQDVKQKLEAEKQSLLELEKSKFAVSDKLRSAERKTGALHEDLEKANRTIRKQEKLLDKLEAELAEETKKKQTLEKQDAALLESIKEWKNKANDLEWKMKQENQSKNDLERRVREMEIKMKYQ